MKRPARVLSRLIAAVLLAVSLSQAEEPAPAEPSPTLAPQPTLVPDSATAPTAETYWQDRPLGTLKASLHRTEGEFPINAAALRLAEAGLMQHSFGDYRPWVISNFEWEAPATRHLPLFFEEPNLERLGYAEPCSLGLFEDECRPWTPECMQPVVSGAHFLGNIAILPYRCGFQPACEPVYTLGTDRPGSPVCYRKHLMPISLRGALYQAGFVTGLVFLIP